MPAESATPRPASLATSALLASAPIAMPRSAASFLSRVSSIGENASSASTKVASKRRAQTPHGSQRSQDGPAPAGSSLSDSRSELTRSLRVLAGDLFSGALMEHLLSLGFAPVSRGLRGSPQITTQHVEA